MNAAVRIQFAQAPASAVAANLGLWAQATPEAPWFYRNGVEPVTPAYTRTAMGAKNYSGC